MGPDNNIAVAGNLVVNANLYFFSWISFVVCVILTLSLLQETFGIDARQADGKQTRWFFLFASSLVVMGSSTRIYNFRDSPCEAFDDKEFCKRTKFGISLGVISCVAALAMTMAIFKHMTAAIMELGASTFLLILWTFGVGFITFGGGSSPGSSIGNLYFSTWISFIICVMLFGKAIQEALGLQQVSSAPNTTSTSQDPDMEAENGGTPPTLPNEEDF